MKKLMIVILAFTLTTMAKAQKIADDKVPAAVMTAFKAKFPNAEKVKWEMENKKDFEANFMIGGVEQSSTFTPEGNWIETEIETSAAGLPAAIKEAISKQFAGYKIKEASKVENVKNGHFYEVELSKGKEVIEVAFSNSGEVLSKKKEGKDEDKD